MRALWKNAKISPRKMRLAANLVRGKSVNISKSLLRFNLKKCCQFLLKVVNSSIANAVQKGEAINNLKIKEIEVGPGMKMKRFMAAAKGRAAPILRRYSNVCVILEVINKNSTLASNLDSGDLAGERVSDIYGADGKPIKDEDLASLEKEVEPIESENTPDKKTVARFQKEMDKENNSNEKKNKKKDGQMSLGEE